jgi:hypothetical protein
LEVKHHARARRWLGAGCALALMCVCASAVLGQSSSTDGKTSGAKAKTAKSTTAKAKTSSNSTAKTGAKKHTTAAAKSNKASSSSSGKAHTSAHSAASTHSKSSAHPSAHSKSSTAASTHNSNSKYASSRKTVKKKTAARGQQKIDPERAQAIQEALIREHYLSGEPAGKWDESSEEAMRRYQADHGWQAKTVPDSRALISLGLGPSHDHLLNPESAMTTEPAAPRSETSTPTSHSAEPGTRVNASPVSPAPATLPTPQSPAASPEKDSSSPQ